MENSTRERGNSLSLRREPINGDLALSVKMADEKAARDKYRTNTAKIYNDAFDKYIAEGKKRCCGAFQKWTPG